MVRDCRDRTFAQSTDITVVEQDAVGSFAMGFTFTIAAAPALVAVTPGGGTMDVGPSAAFELF